MWLFHSTIDSKNQQLTNELMIYNFLKLKNVKNKIKVKYS